jgi:hypothetical protein
VIQFSFKLSPIAFGGLIISVGYKNKNKNPNKKNSEKKIYDQSVTFVKPYSYILIWVPPGICSLLGS